MHFALWLYERYCHGILCMSKLYRARDLWFYPDYSDNSCALKTEGVLSSLHLHWLLIHSGSQRGTRKSFLASYNCASLYLFFKPLECKMDAYKVYNMVSHSVKERRHERALKWDVAFCAKQSFMADYVFWLKLQQNAYILCIQQIKSIVNNCFVWWITPGR